MDFLTVHVVRFHLVHAKKTAKIKDIVKLLRDRPTSFKGMELFPDYKQVLVSKQTYLFFEIDGDRVILLYFWDNARNPKELYNLFGD